MANDNTLNVKVTADVNGLSTGLNKAEKGVKNFGTATTKMATQTNKMSSAVKVNAVPTMTSFSQVIQDAPYGIRGVANNIQQLTSQFGYLSAKTGGSMGALKALAGSLAGPAGILFAVSAVTSLMVSYDKEIKEFIFGTDEAEVATLKLNDALRAQIKIRKELKDELSTAISIAVAEAKLAGKSAEDQFAAGKKWREIEIASLEQQVVEIKKIRLAAAKEAKLKKNQDNEELQTLVKKAYKDEIQLKKDLYDTKARLYLADLNEQIRIQDKSDSIGGEGSKDKTSEELIKRQEALNKEFAQEEKADIKNAALLQKSIDDEAKLITDAEDDKVNAVYLAESTRRKLVAAGNDKELALYDEFVANGKDKILTFAQWKTTQAGIEANSAYETTAAGFERINQLTTEFNQNFSSLVTSGISGAFSDLGTSIGEALASGENIVSAIGSSLLSSLGGFLSDMGGLLIEYGVLAVAKGTLDSAIAAGGPIAIAAGIAAIAIGTALTAAGAAIGSMAASGSDTSTDYSSGSSSSSSYGSSTTNSSSSNGGTYVFEIQGSKLVGVLKNTLNRNSALGGQNLAF